MKYYVIAGEASGDLHSANLCAQINQLDQHAEIRGWGGDLMSQEGVKVVKHYKDLAFMGFIEVLLNIRTILKNIAFCKKDILKFQPDALILVDYPGFNLRIAEWAHKKGIKVFYYISPQIWAWKENRVKKIKQYVDEMYVILPFEKDFYKKHQVDVNFVGHPLLDAVEKFKANSTTEEHFRKFYQLGDKPIIVMLPGSRRQEILKMLPLMGAQQKQLNDYQFVVAAAPSIALSVYDQILKNPSIKVVKGKTYELLQYSTAAMVTSGTATLETGLFKVPQVVCYKGSAISYHIAKWLVKIKYISLVNLILDREAVTELIQNDFNETRLQKELTAILPQGKKREQLLNDYNLLIEKLGGVGASENTAKLMLKTLKVIE